jgi:hypothetical protein
MKNQLTTVALSLTVAMVFLLPRQLLGEENQPHMNWRCYASKGRLNCCSRSMGWSAQK